MSNAQSAPQSEVSGAPACGENPEVAGSSAVAGRRRPSVSGESFAEIPNVGFPFEGSDGKGRECVRRRPRRKTRSRKGPFPPFFPEDGCVYGMRGADGGDVGGGA